MHRGISLMLFSVVLFTGCLRAPVTPTLRYAVDPKVEVGKAEASERTLGIRPFDAALPYKLDIVYRAEGLVLGHYEYQRWAEMPATVMTRALTDALLATGRFRDVGNAADLTRPDLILVGELRRFDEVQTADPWLAECELRLELREALGTKVLWADTLQASVPLEENAVQALPLAMSEAVALVAEQAATAISAH